MVMLVFDLPSFPYVFKVIKDFFPPQKETTREQIKAKYLLVKQHDRVGRMADTLEYSDVAFTLSRFDEALIKELEKHAPSMVEYQRGPLAACRRPEDLIQRYTDGASLAVGTALFCGTIPVIGGIAGGDAFTMRLVDPGHGRTLEHSYKIDVLPIIT